MDAIINWFNNSKDYHTGVALYAALPSKKHHVLKRLNKGKNNQNMATLVSELRKFKNTPVIKPKAKVDIPVTPKPTTQTTINIEAQRKQQGNISVQREFNNLRIGDLPAELRPNFLKAQQVFYNMIELKFALNDLPAEATDSALKIILQIEALDEERDIIWRELNHWKKHKTLLEVPVTDFSNLTPLQLDQKRRNLRSSITKIKKRVDGWYNDLSEETDKHQQKLIENQINKSEKLLFKHDMNINKINKLLCHN